MNVGSYTPLYVKNHYTVKSYNQLHDLIAYLEQSSAPPIMRSVIMMRVRL